MINNRGNIAAGNRRMGPILVADSRVTGESLGYAPMVLRPLKLFRECGVLLACLSFALVLLTLSPALLSAQTAGQVTGRVTDTSGAVVPNAAITLTNVATNAVRATVTTGAGDYTFAPVEPGVYNIQAARSGFKTVAARNIQLSVQQSLRQDFSLEVGATTQEVTVSARGALLQATNATVGTVIENQAINQLPLNGRNYLNLVTLTSNANTQSPSAGQAGSRLGGDRAGQSISVGGQRIMYDYYTLDGVDNTDPDFNTYITLPSIDAIQEFKVQTGVYPAQFGHEATQVNVVTKSGANEFHGALFEFLRNDTVDALPYHFIGPPVKVAPFHWNDYGFEAGGPVWIPKVFNGRNRLFFMVDQEWLKSRTRGTGAATLPTQAELNGDFSTFKDKSGNVIPIYDPSTGTNGTGKTQISCMGVPNVICPSQIDPISKKIMNLLYHPAPGTSAFTGDYPYPTSSKFDRRSLTLRTDFNQSEKLQWAFRWSNGNEPSRNAGFPATAATTGSETITHYNQFMGSNTWTITPTLVNQARFGYTRFYNSLGLLSQGTNNVVGQLGIPGLNPGDPSTWGIPDFTYNGPNESWTNIGDTNDGPYVTTDPVWEIEDDLMLVKGKHTLHLGFEHDHATFNELGNQFSRGVFNFYNDATANYVGGKAQGGAALADFLLGDIHDATYAVSIADANYVRNIEAAYVDDTYKVTPKLTLDLGVRYELTPPWHDTLGNEFIVSLANSLLYPTIPNEPQSTWPFFLREGTCTDAYNGINIRWADSKGNPMTPAPQCANGKFPNTLMQTDYNNWAPRLGLAYSPNSRTVVRTGFGIFFNHDVANARFDMARNLGARVNVTRAVQGVPNLFYSNAVGGGGSIATIKTPYAFSMQYDHKTSYTAEYLLDVQQQVGQNWMFEAGYMGSFSRDLFGFRDANQPIPYGLIGNGTQTPISTRVPYPDFGFIQLVHDIGRGNYNAFSFKVTRRFSRGFNLISSYTYSKSLDDTSGIRNQGNGQLFPQNSLCVLCDYGPSDFNVAHRVTAAVVYDLPVGPGKLWAPSNFFVNGALGGWQASTIATLQSGDALSITTGFDNSGTAIGGFPEDRPDVVTGQSVWASPRTTADWWNAAAFSNATPGTFGNEGRNDLSGPGFINFDGAIHKDFHMWYSESHQLQLRVEAFNLFNHPNWGDPVGNFRSRSFGEVFGTHGSMRQLQFAAKYVF